MKHTIDANPNSDTYYEITVNVTFYRGARDAKTNCLPENATPSEDAEIEYDIVKIVAYSDDENPITSTGDNLELPELVDADKFDCELIEAHKQQLIDDADDWGDYQYNARREG